MAESAESSESTSTVSAGILTNIFLQIVQSPLNIALVGVILFLVYNIFKSRNKDVQVRPAEPELPKLKKKDFTVEELKKYDGTQADGRVLVAVNGGVYDVTRGKRFYGPGGPYAAFGGKDASRGLATFNVTAAGEGYDDLSDLTTMEMDSVKEWESQFKDYFDMWMMYSEEHWPKAIDLESAISRLGKELDALAMDALHSINYDAEVWLFPEAVAYQNDCYEKYCKGSSLCCEYNACELDLDTFCEKMVTLSLKRFLNEALPYITPQIRSKHGLDEDADDEADDETDDEMD